MSTDHIVKHIRVGSVQDKDTTIISFNDQAFAFSFERLKEFYNRLHDRIEFVEALQKVKERTKPTESA